MNARILRGVIVVAPWILGRRILRDVQTPLTNLSNPQAVSTLTVTPLTISASRRDYPTVSENRGKGFVIATRSIISSKTQKLYTARHVISDTGYNYHSNNLALSALHYMTGDLAYAEYSGQVTTGNRFIYTTGLNSNQVLMGQYRNDNRTWLTGVIVSSDTGGVIVDLPVLPGDSGSPVIFSDYGLGIVSQSHNGDQVIVQKINKG